MKVNRVIWPLRFEFDIEFILPEDNWQNSKIPVTGKAIFRQPLIYREQKDIELILKELNPNVSMQWLRDVTPYDISKADELPSPTHQNIINLLLDIGKLQNYVVNKEYPMSSERHELLDVVWRRLPESVPTYVFEVQVGGDLYHALAKLKHAYDIWNSRIFLVASAEVMGSVNQLLSGTFHEIKQILRFIKIEKIQNLYASKVNIYELEKDLGLIP